MAMLDDIKQILRVTNSYFDGEINGLILSSRADMLGAGILPSKANSDSDALIKRAISLYCKAEFGLDNPDYKKFKDSYENLKTRLAINPDYSRYTVTFTVTSSSVALEDALVTFNNTKICTETNGQAIFKDLSWAQNVEYTVSKDGYETVSNTVDVTTDSVSVVVPMVVA